MIETGGTATPPMPPPSPPAPPAATEPPTPPLVVTGGFPSIGQLYSDSWASVRSHFADWVLTSVLSIAVLGVLGVAYAIYVTATTSELGRTGIEVRDPIPFLDLFFFALLVASVCAIRYAFTRTALAIAKGEKPNPGKVWSPDRLLPFIVFEVIAQSLWLAGWTVPFIGPIVIIGAVMYAPFTIIEGRGSGITGLWRSISLTVTRERALPQFGFAFLQSALLAIPVGIWFFVYSWLMAADFENWSGAMSALFGLGAVAVTGLAALTTGIIVVSAAAAAYLRIDDQR